MLLEQEEKYGLMKAEQEVDAKAMTHLSSTIEEGQ
jgi:hypothetical protein